MRAPPFPTLTYYYTRPHTTFTILLYANTVWENVVLVQYIPCERFDFGIDLGTLFTRDKIDELAELAAPD